MVLTSELGTNPVPEPLCTPKITQGLMERDHFEERGVDVRMILKLIFKNSNGEARNGLLWLRIRPDGGRLSIQ
jgi:hypothetical protein